MNQARLKDNTNVVKEELSCVRKLADKISDKSLKQLEQDGVFLFPETIIDSDDLDDENFILKSNGNYYQTGNIMGFIGYGDEKLIIESRFSTNDEDFFFQYLLSRVLDFPNIVDLPTTINNDEKIVDYMDFLFPFYLKAATRKGLFKQYERQEYNDSNIKGQIKVPRHIKINTPFIGKVAYSEREFSYDNNLNELIRHTIEFLKTKPYGYKILKKADDEVKQIVDVTKNYSVQNRNKVINNNLKHPIVHAYFKEYRALQQLCLMILQNKRHGLGQGKKKIYGILFDGSWLWEEYINKLIGEYYYHPMNKAGKGVQWLFNNNTGKVYPDFISKNTENRIIADAKYKPVNNIGNKDYLQILAYMFRFDSKKGFFLYPETSGSNMVTMNLNKGSSYEKNVKPRLDISVVKLGLNIPCDAKSYNDFVKSIKTSENELINVVRENAN